MRSFKSEDAEMKGFLFMKFEFIADLDEYFCEKYANYDKLCILPGYKMPKMQDTQTDAFGRLYSYTLPADTMALSKQEKKAELLAELKERMYDKNFSFSFRPLGFFERILDKGSKVNFSKVLKETAARYNVQPMDLANGLNIDPAIWKKIVKGSFYPSKNLVLALGLSAHFSYRDVKDLLQMSGYSFDFSNVLDVVVSYLLVKGIYNSAMVDAALQEYKILPMMIAKE